ncbi:MAG: hypothetical protein LBI62_06315 [Candidatus Accumulibacter sp.]|nr:hypothetical protein [Accumulibacter sp.]
MSPLPPDRKLWGAEPEDQGSGIRDQKMLPAASPPRECWGAGFYLLPRREAPMNF